MNRQPTRHTKPSPKLRSRHVGGKCKWLFQTTAPIRVFPMALPAHFQPFHLKAGILEPSWLTHICSTGLLGVVGPTVNGIFIRIKHVHPHSYMDWFSERGKLKKTKHNIWGVFFKLPRLISPFRCHAALKNRVPFFPIITEHSRKHQPLAKASFVCVSWRDCLRSVSFSPLRSSALVSKYSTPPSPLPLDCANHLFCSVTPPPPDCGSEPPPTPREEWLTGLRC